MGLRTSGTSNSDVQTWDCESTDIVYIVNCALIITIPLWLALVLIGGKRDLELGALSLDCYR